MKKDIIIEDKFVSSSEKEKMQNFIEVFKEYIKSHRESKKV